MSDINELSFEQAYSELSEIIAQLESGESTLADTVALYERGRLLADRCQTTLDEAELRVKRLDDDGSTSDL